MMHHHPAYGLPVGRRFELGCDPAARYDADTIRQIEHVVEVIADHHNSRSTGAGLEEPLVHRRTGANVEAAAWAVRDDDSRGAAEFAGDDELLRIAAGEKRGALPQIANALHVEFADRTRGCLAHGGSVGPHP